MNKPQVPTAELPSAKCRAKTRAWRLAEASVPGLPKGRALSQTGYLLLCSGCNPGKGPALLRSGAGVCDDMA